MDIALVLQVDQAWRAQGFLTDLRENLSLLAPIKDVNLGKLPNPKPLLIPLSNGNIYS